MIYECNSNMSRQEFIQSYIEGNKSQIKVGEISDGYHTFNELYEVLRETLAHINVPTFDDERLNYVDVQISRSLIDDIKKVLARAEGRE